MNTEIFREYDIRGNVERDLTDEVVRDIGRAFGSYMVSRGKKNASICRDCRLSSERYRDILVEAMTGVGLDVTDIGLAPTPLFYFSLFKLDVEGGIMITGSHNPPTIKRPCMANRYRTCEGRSRPGSSYQAKVPSGSTGIS